MAFDPEAVRAFEHARWEHAASAYPRTFALATRTFIDARLDAAAVTAGMQVLDIACGTGEVAARVVRRAATATGLDFSPAMLAVARSAHPDLVFRHGDAVRRRRVRCGSGEFRHPPRPNPALVLREAARVLRPGGRFALSIWASQWASQADNVAGSCCSTRSAGTAIPPPPTHRRPVAGFLGPPHCTEALLQAGFDRPEIRLERRIWRHADAASLVAALRAGTARMAAMIDAQPAAAMPAILADIQRQAADWRDGAGLALPIAAVIAAGVKR